ncbi:MAG TPA: FadR/GntR family transcriptional regulator [Spirochaetia bacterium]|nr:FadR/GntR family transcriptional regulator [Spirochaetia bacterium]
MSSEKSETVTPSELTSIKRVSVRGQIFDQIKNNVLSGAWPPGTKIPSEKELTTIFGVSRISIREALQKLVALDLLETHQGDGTYVKHFKADSYADGFLAFLAFSRPGVREIAEFRKIVEVGAIEIAIPNATEEDIVELANCVARMHACEDVPEEHVVEDLSFHTKIIELSRNGIIIHIYHGIHELLTESMLNILTDEGKKNALKYHSAILQDFKKRDVESAKMHLNQHYTVAMKRILSDENIERI